MNERDAFGSTKKIFICVNIRQPSICNAKNITPSIMVSVMNKRCFEISSRFDARVAKNKVILLITSTPVLYINILGNITFSW